MEINVVENVLLASFCLFQYKNFFFWQTLSWHRIRAECCALAVAFNLRNWFASLTIF